MRILCATDLLPGGEAAIERAGLLAQQLDAELTILHVTSPKDSAETLGRNLKVADERARCRKEPAPARLRRPAVVTVPAGDPSRIILETLAQSNAKLLVLGPHRKSPLPVALEGTIAANALAARNCPVLVVRNQVRDAYRRVLLALDFSEGSLAAVRAAESLVLTPDVMATVVHAHKPPVRGMLQLMDPRLDSIDQYGADWVREADHAVRELLEYESANAARYDIRIERQPAAPAILQAIDRCAPDLVVMGTRGAGRLRRALGGSIANRVLHGATCDVLIVPEGSFGASRSKMDFGAHRAREATSAFRDLQ
ncbi:MAG TPA: universal stress protein [Steroidobacteraceae bacterium]|nr:universal stress protein [Steroidobacteraceae bacterium]